MALEEWGLEHTRLKGQLLLQRVSLPTEHIHRALARLWPRRANFFVLVSQRAHFDIPGERDNRLWLQHVSFGRMRNKTISFTSPEEVRQQATLLRGDSGWQAISTENVELYFRAEGESHLALDSLASATLDIVSTFLATSDVQQDIMVRASRRYTSEFLAQHRDKPYDFLDICRHVATTFKVHCFYVHHNPDGGAEVCGPGPNGIGNRLLSNQTVVTTLERASQSRLALGGALLEGKTERHYRWIPIPDIGEASSAHPVPGSGGSAAVLLTAPRPLPTMCIQVASNLIGRLASRTHLTGRLRQLESLHESMRAAPVAEPLDFGHLQKRILLRSFAELCLEGVCLNSRAHSATIRLYDPFLNELVFLAGYHRSGGSYRDGRKPRISLSDWGQSINAFCFQCRNPHQPVVIPNVRNIPAEYLQLGLRKALIARPNTRSEVCFSLYVGDIAIGVMNIESAMPFLPSDVRYFASIADIYCEQAKVVDRGADAYWLANIDEVNEALHDLKDALDRERERVEETADGPLERAARRYSTAKERIQRDASLTAQREHLPWSDFVRDIEEIAQPYGVSIETDVGSAQQVVPIGQNTVRTARLLVANLAKNAYSYSDPATRSVIQLRYRTGPQNGAGNNEIKIVEMEYQGDASVSVLAPRLNRLGCVPIFEIAAGAEDLELHWGLFLCGAHARLVNGVLQVEQCNADQASRPVRIFVRLPVEPQLQAGFGQ